MIYRALKGLLRGLGRQDDAPTLPPVVPREREKLRLPVEPPTPPLTCITMPHRGQPLHLLAPGVRGLRYADETGIYITFIENVGSTHAATKYLAAQRRKGVRVVVVEVLHRGFADRLRALGFADQRLKLRVVPLLLPREMVAEVEADGGRVPCDCLVWTP